MIVEPVAGSTGVLIPPKGYLERLREICDRHGILLIFDEVITGFGRLGAVVRRATKFGVDAGHDDARQGHHERGRSDGRRLRARARSTTRSSNGAPAGIELFHGYTYSGHPLAAAAGLATLELYRSEGLFERAASLESYWADAVHSLRGSAARHRPAQHRPRRRHRARAARRRAAARADLRLSSSASRRACWFDRPATRSRCRRRSSSSKQQIDQMFDTVRRRASRASPERDRAMESPSPRDRSTFGSSRSAQSRARRARRRARCRKPSRTDSTATAAQRTRDARLERGHVAAAGRRQHAGRSARSVDLSRTRADHAHARQPSRLRRRQVSNCTSCHLDEGRRPNAAPLIGVFARFPKFMDRSGAVVPIEDRINYCFTRSLAGSKLPPDSREMQDIVAYLAFISKGVPTGEHVRGEGCPKMPKLFGDSARGRKLFTDNCARCHGNDGAGMGPDPRAVGREVVQHRRVDGAHRTRGVVHSAQHAVRSSRVRSPISNRTTSPPTSRRCPAPTRRARKPIGPTAARPPTSRTTRKATKPSTRPKSSRADQPGRRHRRDPLGPSSTSSRYRSAHEPTRPISRRSHDRRRRRRGRRRAALQASGLRRSAASDGCARRARLRRRAGDPTKAPGAPTTAVGNARRSSSRQRAPVGEITGTTLTPLQDLAGNDHAVGSPLRPHPRRHPDDRPGEAHAAHSRSRRPPDVLHASPTSSDFPSVTRVHFIECSGNGRSAYRTPKPRHDAAAGRRDDRATANGPAFRCLSLLREVGREARGQVVPRRGRRCVPACAKHPGAEGDATTRSIVWAQNGEPLRPEQGFPIRLLLPGFEGNSNVKWLRRIKLGTEPFMTRWETSKYTDPLPGGKVRQFSFEMDAKSIITSPAFPERLSAPDGGRFAGSPGAVAVASRASTSARTAERPGRRRRCRSPATRQGTGALSATCGSWTGDESLLMSRAVDETGYVQPTLAQLQAAFADRAPTTTSTPFAAGASRATAR